MTVYEKKYLAGYFDGEGYIGIVKLRTPIKGSVNNVRYIPVVKVASVDETVIKIFQEHFGGYLSKRIHAQVNHRESYMWEIKNNTSVKYFIDKMQDQLLIKYKQCFVVDGFIDWKVKRRLRRVAGQRGIRAYTPEEMAFQESLYQQIRVLNFRGIRPAETK